MKQEYDLDQGACAIGRLDENDIVLDDDLVSGNHARLDIQGDNCTISDLSSANGTLLQGKPLVAYEAKMLQHGDVIEIVPFQLTYEYIQEEVINASGELEEDTLHRLTVTGRRIVAEELTPPGKPPADPPFGGNGSDNGRYEIPPGLKASQSSYVQYLPDFYNTTAMHHFMAVFEAVWVPIEWQIDHFNLNLNPFTAPKEFLPWLANWFTITFDESWNEQQQRELLDEAPWIYKRRGTKGALEKVLQIYTGEEPIIDDDPKSQPPHRFAVTILLSEQETKREIVEQLIEAHKPAHTNYQLSFI